MAKDDVMIIGAGIGGLTAALSLQHFGIPVQVYERSAELGEVGAGLSLGPNATHVFQALGVDAAMRRVCTEPDKLAGKDYKTGAIVTSADAIDWVKRYGAPYYQGHRADIHGVLADAVRARDPNAIQLNRDLVGWVSGDKGIDAIFADGTRAHGAVLVGCDGIKSIVREKLWDPKAPHFLGHVVYRGLTAVADLPPGLITPSSSSFRGPHRHFTRYLIRNGSLVNYVAFTERTDWADEGWSVPATVDEVLENFTGWAPELQLIVRNTLPGRCHKWGLFGRDPLPR